MANKKDYLSKLCEQLSTDIASSLSVSKRCKIIKDNGDNTFNVQPLAMYSNGEKRAPLMYLPVAYIPISATDKNGDKVNFKLDYNVGDTVVVVFDDRDTTNYKNGTSYSIDGNNVHDINDGIIVGKIYNGKW